MLRPSGLVFIVLALLTSILTRLFLASFPVSLSYFIAVPIHKCLGKHLFMKFTFPIARVNGTFFFSQSEIVLALDETSIIKN